MRVDQALTIMWNQLSKGHPGRSFLIRMSPELFEEYEARLQALTRWVDVEVDVEPKERYLVFKTGRVVKDDKVFGFVFEPNGEY